MPLYEYECRACGKHTDVRHGFDDKNSESCPECGGELARVFGVSGIAFKGSGFYINDSKKSSGGGAASAPAATSAAGADAKPAESKPDAKPDAKSESKSGSDVTAA